jgi:hypothetical protein
VLGCARHIRIAPKQELSSRQNVRPEVVRSQDFLFGAGISDAGILDAAI